MDYLFIFLTSLAVGFSGAASPGPLLTVTINESYKKGFLVGPLMMVGHSILELFLLVIIFMGLDRYLRLDLVIGSISFFGSFLLVILGINILKDVFREHLSFKLSNKKSVGMHPIISGILVSLSNPFWTIWWIMIGYPLIFILIDKISLRLFGIFVFYMGHILSDFIWYSFVSYSVVYGKKFISEKYFKIIISICGIFLIYLAGYFFITGINKLGLKLF
ncbi:MAG: LysE family transporter [Actinomycetia bacterium]|nr:LysE family transporter [Actinomycetes bacterium]